jgi:hypothetical protein
MQINYFYATQWNKRNAIIYIQLKIKCKIIILKTLKNGFNKSYFMTYQRGIYVGGGKSFVLMLEGKRETDDGVGELMLEVILIKINSIS